MKLLRSFLFLSLGLLIVVPLSAADDDQPKKKRGRPEAKRPERGRGNFADRLSQLVPTDLQDKLKLSNDQKDKIAKLQKEFEDKTKDASAKVKDAMAKARENKDREAFRKIADDLQAIGKTRDEYRAKVSDVLNADQKKQLEEATRGRGGRFGQPPARPDAERPQGRGGLNPFLLQRLDLTKEQQEKIDKLRKDFDDKVEGVLTADQKKKLDDLKKQGPFGGRPPRRPNR